MIALRLSGLKPHFGLRLAQPSYQICHLLTPLCIWNEFSQLNLVASVYVGYLETLVRLISFKKEHFERIPIHVFWLELNSRLNVLLKVFVENLEFLQLTLIRQLDLS